MLQIREEKAGAMSRGANWLVFAPFLVAAVLVSLWLLFPFTGIGPNGNTFAAFALAAIGVSFAVGVVSLFLARKIGVWWRLLMGVLYLPTAVFSLLLAGF